MPAPSNDGVPEPDGVGGLAGSMLGCLLSIASRPVDAEVGPSPRQMSLGKDCREYIPVFSCPPENLCHPMFANTIRPLLWMTPGLLALALAGCETLPLSQRQFISQPGMLFDGTGAHKFDGGLTSQIETGRAASGGAASGGCSSCR